MGSASSTPTTEGSTDPWWTIENQNLDLNPVAAANDINPMENFRDLVEEQRGQVDDQRRSEVQLSGSESSASIEVENMVSVNEPVAVSNDESDNAAADGAAQQPDDDAQRSSSVDLSHRQTLEEFKEELRIKREKRKCAIAELRNEILSLRKQLETEKSLNKKLMTAKEANVDQHDCFNGISVEYSPSEQLETNISLRTQLSGTQFELQKTNAENLMLSSELAATNRKTQSLKDIIAACKEIIAVRETELTQVISLE